MRTKLIALIAATTILACTETTGRAIAPLEHSSRAAGIVTSPNITVTIDEPTADQTYAGGVTDSLPVRIHVTHTYALSGKPTASIGDRVTKLVKQNDDWVGALPLAGVPHEQFTLTVTVADVINDTTQAARTLLHDVAPSVSISSDGSVARPRAWIDASCVDDAPGCTLTVMMGNVKLGGPYASPMHERLSFAPWEGALVQFSVVAEDSVGQTRTGVAGIYVESSDRLKVLGKGGAPLWDARGSRLLWSNVVLNVSTQQVDSFDFPGTMGMLIPRGVALCCDPPGNGQTLVARNGAQTIGNYGHQFSPNGAYSIQYTPIDNFVGTLTRTNLTTLQEVVIKKKGAMSNPQSVADNGDVAFWTSSTYGDTAARYKVWRWRAGVLMRVSQDTKDFDYDPITDGVNIVFQHFSNFCCTHNKTALQLFDGASVITLVPAQSRTFVRGVDYLVNNGWTAFTNKDVSGNVQVWTRSPEGTLRQATSFTGTTTVEAIGPDGTVIVQYGGSRYTITPTGSPVRLSWTLGKAVWRNNEFLVLIGNTAFNITP